MVNMAKSYPFSGPQFPHLYKGGNNTFPDSPMNQEMQSSSEGLSSGIPKVSCGQSWALSPDHLLRPY